jgi:CRISPR-associated protein Csy3
MKTAKSPSAAGRVFKKLPSIASFRRCHVISDAEMFSILPDGTRTPVGIYRTGLRGTQNVNDGVGNMRQKRNGDEGDRGVQQPQVIDAAKVDGNAVGMLVKFGLSMLDLRDGLENCLDSQEPGAAVEFRSSIADFVARARDSNAIYLLACRYARNIANGRWLWRNRTIARSVQISVYNRQGRCIAEFDALSLPMNHFDEMTPAEVDLAHELAEQMHGRSLDGLTIAATLTLCVAGAVEVFPSQNYIERDRRKGSQDDVSRSLYRVRSTRATDDHDGAGPVGYAGLRDAKIFNAIRTIDTWYDDYEENGVPIPVEPLGASIAHQEFFRRGERCAFEMFKRLDQISPVSADGLYCLACVERGGVYGPARLISAKKDHVTKASSPDDAPTSVDGPSVAALSTDTADVRPTKTKKTVNKAAAKGAKPVVRTAEKRSKKAIDAT